MSNLNPGGSRSKGPRVFGAENIRRACQQNRVPDADRPNGSIADRPHKGTRERERYLRRLRAKAPYGPMCRDPELCAGKGYCPRDPTCGD